MNERDLTADLRLCESSTPDGFEIGCMVNPDPDPGEGDFWHVRSTFHRTVPKDVAEKYAVWCAAARAGWPHAIQRALAAEAECARLRTAVSAHLAACPACRGTGRTERREYDSASDEMEWAGTEPCRACAGLRAVVEDKP